MTDTDLIVTRTIPLAEPAATEAIGSIHAEGLIGIRALAPGWRIEVTYDLRRLGLDALKAVLAGAGLRPSERLFARLAWKWIRFQEDNVRAQASIVHHCCNVPPSDER